MSFGDWAVEEFGEISDILFDTPHLTGKYSSIGPASVVGPWWR